MADKDWRQSVIERMLPAMEANAGTGPATTLPPAPTVTITAQAPFSAGFLSPPSFDAIELLPPAAAEKLRMLRQRSADAHAVIPPFEDVRSVHGAH